MNTFTIKEKNIIDEAISIMENNFKQNSVLIDSAIKAKGYCQLQLAMKDREHFGVMFLDTKNRLIEFEILFKGGLSSSEVHVAVIAKKALLNNSKNILLSHNHPTSDTTPSEADKNVTEKISKALILFNIKVIDHIIVGALDSYSFAENGLI